MTKSDIEALCRGFGPVVLEFVESAVAPLRSQIADLESKLSNAGSSKSAGTAALVIEKNLETLAKALGPVVAKHIREGVRPVAERCDVLEREVQHVKSSQVTLADAYKGIWSVSFDPYPRGSAVTSNGSLWLARTDTKAKPGASDDWQLIVKRGADGKDLR